MMGECGGWGWQSPRALPLGYGSRGSSGFPKVEGLDRGERTSLSVLRGYFCGREERAEGDLSFSLTTLPHQVCCMLNTWGIILYLLLPWITAQVGLGVSSGLCWAVGSDYRIRPE